MLRAAVAAGAGFAAGVVYREHHTVDYERLEATTRRVVHACALSGYRPAHLQMSS